MKQFLLLILVALCVSFYGYVCVSGKPRSSDPLLDKLKAAREKADEYYLNHGDDLISLSKVQGINALLEISDTLLQKANNKWPDKMEYSYDILKDPNGRIIYIDKILTNDNTNQIQILIHYFNKRGDTYAFREKESMLFDDIKPKLVIGDHLWYYNQDFKIIGESDTIVDSNHHFVKLTKDERIKLDFKHNAYRNLVSCLKAYGIKLKK